MRVRFCATLCQKAALAVSLAVHSRLLATLAVKGLITLDTISVEAKVCSPCNVPAFFQTTIDTQCVLLTKVCPPKAPRHNESIFPTSGNSAHTKKSGEPGPHVG
jgi:hypothetical protein